MATETISTLISKYTGSDADVIYGGTQHYIIGRNPEEESPYYFSAANSSSATAYMEWGFDLSSIPDDAEIDSVSCLAGGHCATTYHSSYVAQLYSGNTAKGNEGSLLESRHSTVTFDGGSWTRDELQDCRVRFTGTRKRSGTNKYCFVAGARITVTYTYQNEKFMLKLDGSYSDVARVFKKVSGIWVEQTELADVVEQSKTLVNGGEIIT